MLPGRSLRLVATGEAGAAASLAAAASVGRSALGSAVISAACANAWRSADRAPFSTSPVAAGEIREGGKRLMFAEHGAPADVVKLVDGPSIDPSLPLEDDEIHVRWLAAPINPADINVVEGTYALLPEVLPAVGGNEGVAEVVAVGAGIEYFTPGDWVVPRRPLLGTWRSEMVDVGRSFLRVSRDLPLEVAATLTVNPPTAFRMLVDFANLKEGDSVIQNGANSGVGTAVIQLARRMGVRTINVIRDRDDADEVKQHLSSLGADVVLTDSEMGHYATPRLMEHLQQPCLGLNCVGGKSATNIARALSNGGTMVTYGGMSRKPITVPTSLFIFKDISLRGFWMTRWHADHSTQERREFFAEMTKVILGDHNDPPFVVPTQDYAISDYAAAIEHAQSGFTGTKALLRMADPTPIETSDASEPSA